MSVAFHSVSDNSQVQAQEQKGPRVNQDTVSAFSSVLQSVSKEKINSARSTPSAASNPLSSKNPNSERIFNAVMVSSEKYNLPPALVLGFIKQESGFNPQARSWCGAQGLMQLMPATAKDLGVKDAYNIEQNVDGGCKYIRQMLNRFDGDLPKAVAAYNAGPGAVAKHNGIPPYKETQKYVPAVLAHYEKFSGEKISTTIASTEATAVIKSSKPSQPKIDYNLAMQAIQSSDLMTSTAISYAMVGKIQPMDLPNPNETWKESPEPPPPPPPSAVRV